MSGFFLAMAAIVALSQSVLSCTAGDTCTVGAEGCKCNEGACLTGLQCASNVCVDLADSSATGGPTAAVSGDSQGGSSGEGGGSASEPTASSGTLAKDAKCDSNEQCAAGLQCLPVSGDNDRCGARVVDNETTCLAFGGQWRDGGGCLILCTDPNEPWPCPGQSHPDCISRTYCSRRCDVDNPDCPAGMQCGFGFCNWTCSTNSDCPTGLQCTESRICR